MAVQTGKDGLSGRYIVCRLTKAGHIARVRLQALVRRKDVKETQIVIFNYPNSLPPQSGVLPPACFEMLALLSFLNTICIFIMILFILMIIMV